MVRADPVPLEWRDGALAFLLAKGMQVLDNAGGGNCLYYTALSAVAQATPGVECTVWSLRKVAGQPLTPAQARGMEKGKGRALPLELWGDSSHLGVICVSYQLCALVLQLDFTAAQAYSPFWWEPATAGGLDPEGQPPKFFIAVSTVYYDDPQQNHWYLLKGPDGTVVWNSYPELPQFIRECWGPVPQTLFSPYEGPSVQGAPP